MVARQYVTLFMEQFLVRTAGERLAQVDARGPQLIDKGPIAPHLGRSERVGQMIVGDVPIDQQVEGHDELGKELRPFALRADGCGSRRLDQPHRYIECAHCRGIMSQGACRTGIAQKGHELQVGIGLDLPVQVEGLARELLSLFERGRAVRRIRGNAMPQFDLG